MTSAIVMAALAVAVIAVTATSVTVMTLSGAMRVIAVIVVALRRSRVGATALDDLVEFAAIEPHAATIRAIVDLDALTIAHDQPDTADRAQHATTALVVNVIIYHIKKSRFPERYPIVTTITKCGRD